MSFEMKPECMRPECSYVWVPRRSPGTTAALRAGRLRAVPSSEVNWCAHGNCLELVTPAGNYVIDEHDRVLCEKLP
jgi:hypothetical protein